MSTESYPQCGAASFASSDRRRWCSLSWRGGWMCSHRRLMILLCSILRCSAHTRLELQKCFQLRSFTSMTQTSAVTAWNGWWYSCNAILVTAALLDLSCNDEECLIQQSLRLSEVWLTADWLTRFRLGDHHRGDSCWHTAEFNWSSTAGVIPAIKRAHLRIVAVWSWLSAVFFCSSFNLIVPLL